MPTYNERLEGGLIGLLVGDALGVPYEFHDADDIPPPDQIEYAPPVGYHRRMRGRRRERGRMMARWRCACWPRCWRAACSTPKTSGGG